MKRIFSILRYVVSIALVFFVAAVTAFSQTIIPAEIPTSYNVGKTGGFTYSIPLTIPPGIREMVPALAITYNSQSGNGNLGSGWSLAGLSTISRTVPTIYHNHMLDPVDFDGNDVFSLDGQKLVETSPGVYMTEIKNFAKIETHGTAGNGPSYFTVQYPNGTIYEYGNTADSKMLAQGRSDVLMWCVNKISDLNGNYIEFGYDNNYQDGIYTLAYIKYSLNSNVSQSITNPILIDFSYASSPDISKTWVAGSVLKSEAVLSGIHIKQDNVTINEYEFTYEHSLLGSPDYFSHLTEIKEIKPGNVQLPPIKINWGARPIDEYQEITLPQWAGALAEFTGDFNGDGATDNLVTSGVANNAPFYVNINDKNGGYNQVSVGSVHYTISGVPNIPLSIAQSSKKGSLFFDYNGDGLDDLILTIADHTDPANPKLVLEYYQSDGTNLTYNSTLYSHSMNDSFWIDLCSIIPGDFDGDGKKEIIVTEPWGFTIDTVGGIIYYTSRYEHDLVRFFTGHARHTVWQHRLGYSLEQHAWGYNLYIIGDNYPTNNGAVQTNNNYIASIQGHNYFESAMDYNGDGKDDFCRVTDGQSTPFEIYSIDIDYTGNPTLNNPGSSLTTLVSRAYPAKDWYLSPGDFNGDGKSDILTWEKNYGWEIYYSKDNGDFDVVPAPSSFTSNVHLNGFDSTVANQVNCYYVVGDYNGDGRDDILELGNIATSLITSKYYSVFYSYGHNNFLHELKELPLTFQTGNRMKMGDFNGDGQLDVMGFDSTSTSMSPAIIYFHPNDQEHTVTSIEHAGKKWSIEYKSLSSATESDQDGDHYGYFPWSVNGHTPREYPYVSRQLPIKVVTSLKDNVTLDNSYYYQTLSMHMTGLGMLGFEKVRIYDNSKQLITENRYSLFPFWGTLGQYSRTHFLYETVLSSFNNPSYAATTTRMSYLDVPGNTSGDVRIIKNYGTILIDNINGRYEDTYNQFNYSSTLFYDYGVSDSIHVEQGVRNGYIVTTTKYKYDSTLSIFNRWKPIASTKRSTYPSKPTYTISESFLYNSTGLLQEQYDFNKTTYSYDVFGNVTSKVFIPGVPFSNKVEDFEYSADGRFMTKDTKYNNGYPFVDEFEYDKWGNVLVHRHDLLTTYNLYDEVNRIKRTSHPDDVVTETEYDWAFNSSHNPPSSFTSLTGTEGPTYYLNAARFSIKHTTVGISGAAYEYVDFYGRKLRDAHPSFDGTMTYTDIDYYAMGGTHRATDPYPQNTPPSNYTEFSYNDYGLEESRTRMTGPSLTTSYTTSTLPAYMATTVTNISNTAAQQVKTTYTDARGTYQVDDNGNTIEYSFASNGKEDEIIINSDPHLKTTMTYDIRGRLKTKDEPNFGTTTYTYNKLDQIIREELPTGTDYTYTYDDFGNVTKKEDNYFNTYEYIYYPSSLPSIQSSGAGKIRQEKFTYYESGNPNPFITTYDYEYDVAGRLLKLKESIDPAHIFTTRYTYNLYSQVVEIEYPSGLKLNKNYNQYGFLEEVRLPSRKLWQQYSVNHRGQTEYAEYYDNSSQPVYSANHLYDDLGFPQLRRINAISGMLGTPIAWANYTFDHATSNLSNREDYLRNLQESFTYDAYDRLTNITPTASVPPLQMRYSDEGNILSRNDISNTQYDWKYDRYALKMVPDGDPYVLPLSLLSNVRQPNSQYISYHTFNRVKDIKEAGNEVHYQYGPANERVKAIYNPGTLGSIPQKVRYYGADYEETVENGITTKVHYIWGDGEIVAIVRDVQGTATVYFVGTDYLGSITHLLDGQGTGIVEERSFDAWGRYRDPSNWQYYPPNSVPNWIIDRGYTGHEHVFVNGYDVNIINMNARLYDPLTGRMFSPDPYVADETSSQAYNRYSYAMNNPLKFTDPSGKFVWFVPVIFAAVNVGMDLIMNKGKMTIGEIAMSAGMGALSGMLAGGITTVSSALFAAGINQINRFIPSIPIIQAENFSLNLSPMVGFGTSGITAGANINSSVSVGGFSYSLSLGGGVNSGVSSLDQDPGAGFYTNHSDMVNFNVNHTTYGVGFSYNDFTGRTAQGIGAVHIQIGDFSARLDEDFFGDGYDRYRTGGLLTTYKIDDDLSLALGGSMLTGWASSDKETRLYSGNPKYGNPNLKRGNLHNSCNEKYADLRGGTLYGGIIYKGQANFIGHNSERRLHKVQNLIHRYITTKTPYFENLGKTSSSYSYTGGYHSNYLFY